MASFNFSQADGTTLEAIDAKWNGASTTLVTSSGLLQPDGSSSGYASGVAWYEDGHGAAQKSQAVLKQCSSTYSASTGVAVRAQAGDQYYFFTVNLTDMQLRRGSTYLSAATGLTGLDTADRTVSIEIDSSHVITCKVNGSTVITYDDSAGPPLTGGYPGLSYTGDGNLANQRFDDWTDGVAGGPPPPDPQSLYPDADISDGPWTPSTGTDLFSCIDETSANDTDYITTSANGTAEIGFQNGTTPDTGTQTFRYRAIGSAAKALVAALYDGATLIQSWTVDPLPQTITQYDRVPTTGFTSLADPRVRFTVQDAASPPALSVTWGAVGTAASGTTTAAPAYPTGIGANTSKLFCVVTGRSNTADTAPTMPAGWTSVLDFEGGTGTWGVDAGTRRVTVFRKDTVTGSETGTVTVSLAGTTANTLRASILRVEVPAGYGIDVAASTGADTTSGTAFSATGSSTIGFQAGDLLLIAVAQAIDSATQSAQAITASGITFGTRTNRASTAVTNGNDHRHIIDSVPVSSGSGTVAPTYAYTASAAASGPVGFLRLRAVAPTEFGRVTWSKLEAPGTSGGGASLTTSINTAIQASRFSTASLNLAIRVANSSAASINTAIALHNTSNTSIQTAIQQAKTTITSLNTAIRQAKSISIIEDLAISVAHTSTHLIDTVIRQNKTSTVSINTVIQRALNSIASIDTVIQQHLNLSTQISLMVQAVTSATFSINLQIQVPSSLSISINAAILQSKTANPIIDTAIQRQFANTATINTAIKAVNNLNIAVNTGILLNHNTSTNVQTVVQQARSITSSLEAVIRANKLSTVNVETAIRAIYNATTQLNTVVQQRNISNVDIDTAIQQAINAITNINTVIATSEALTTQISLLVQAATNASFAINMQIQIPNSVSAALGLAIREAKSINLPFDTAIRLAKTAQTAVNMAINQNKSALTSFNIPIQANHTLQQSIDLAIQMAKSSQFTINTAVAQLKTTAINLNMQIQAGFTQSSLIDLAISRILNTITSINTAIQLSNQSTILLDLVVALHNQVIFDIDMLILARKSVLASVSLYVDDGSTIVPSPERTFTAVQGGRTTTRDSQGRFVKAAYGRTYVKPSR